jgi:hypothetical protein
MAIGVMGGGHRIFSTLQMGVVGRRRRRWDGVKELRRCVRILVVRIQWALGQLLSLLESLSLEAESITGRNWHGKTIQHRLYKVAYKEFGNHVPQQLSHRPKNSCQSE